MRSSRHEIQKLLNEVVSRAREVCTAWHEASRLDGPDRFARALEDLEELVGRNGNQAEPVATHKPRHTTTRIATAFISKAVSYSGADCLLWPYGKSSGYGRLGKGYVHRLVCEAVHGLPPSSRHQAAHSCGVRACINPAHLRWDTPKGNQADQIGHFGGQHSNAVLTVDQVREILSQDDRTDVDLAEQYHVASVTINAIRRRRNWSWL